MPTLYIDNKPYAVEGEGRNLLKVCLSLGFNVPYFCWHPAMHSVGACRQCAVKQFKDAADTRGRIIMSCMTTVTDGMRISIDDAEAVAFRRKVIEWLMENHPHDCPVCDEGGECHLQDMTVMTGHVYRKHRFRKRTHRNQDLGPFVAHEMNRCIQCYRCVRFYRDYAGGRDLDVFGWHNGVYFGRQCSGTLESEFAGNLVEVCPTGVFTDKTLARHYTRKWDLQTAPSVCVHCGLGCNTIPGERYGLLRRVYSRYNSQVNGYFLCDRGRYGYEFVNCPQRIRNITFKSNDVSPDDSATTRATDTAFDQSFAKFAATPDEQRQQTLSQIASLVSAGKVIGIGSPRASLESNFALQTLVGKENFYHGVNRRELALVRKMIDILRHGPSPAACQQDVHKSHVALVLGEDVAESAPMLSLALRQSILQAPIEQVKKEHISDWDDASIRQAIQWQKGPLFVLTPAPTRIDELAAVAARLGPDELAAVATAVAHEIDPAAPDAAGLGEEHRALARQIAQTLREHKNPVVITGPSCGSEALLEAAANIAWSLCKGGQAAKLCFIAPACNSMGTAMIDADAAEDALAAVRNGQAQTVIVLENDLYRCLPKEAADELLAKARNVIALDHVATATTRRAGYVLPAATFAECTGTLVNNEVRAQRSFQVFVPGGDVLASWRWLGEIAALAGKPGWKDFDDVLAALAAAVPALADAVAAAPGADFRMLGQKVPRQSHRHTGRTSNTADISVHEPKPPQDRDAPMNFSMEGYRGQPPAALIPRWWSPGWNSVQAVNKFQAEINGPLTGGDPGVRLIPPTQGDGLRYFQPHVAPAAPRQGQLLVLAAQHVFGSDDLSMHSPGVAQLAPQPYLALSPADAQHLGLAPGQPATLKVGSTDWPLPVRVVPTLPQGLALAAVLPATAGLILPAWGGVSAGGPA